MEDNSRTKSQLISELTELRKQIADRETLLSERNRLEKEMHTLSTAVQQSSDWILITDKSGKIEYVNDAVEKVTGYTREEILGKTPRILKSGRHDKDFYKKMWDTILSGQTYTATLTNRKKEGELSKSSTPSHQSKTIRVT